jgi:hypothetical protein
LNSPVTASPASNFWRVRELEGSPVRAFALTLIFVLSAGALYADEPPKLLVDAAQCLATSKEDWLALGRRKPTDLEMGLVTDDKSDPGEQMLYVVDFASPLHTSGSVATFIVDGKEPHLTLRLQYNVHFVQSDEGAQSVQLVNPPFGGIGTQRHVVNAIHKVGFRTWSIPVQSLVTTPNAAECQSEAPTQ